MLMKRGAEKVQMQGVATRLEPRPARSAFQG